MHQTSGKSRFSTSRLIPLTGLSGIDVVRNKIKQFAQKKVTLPPGRHKIIILDEADRQDVRQIGALLLTLTPA